MARAGSIVYVGIAPHPPIMVPEVGGAAVAEVRGSIAAMRELTRRIIASGAETLVLISPHAPLAQRAFVAYDEPESYGDFANFRAPEAIVRTPLDAELLDAIAATAAEDGYQLLRLGHGHELDHGAAVPLYFLLRNGWQGRVVTLGYSFLATEDHIRFGACVRHAAIRRGRPVAFIASGDLSHRLKPDAPAGYDPNESSSSIKSCAQGPASVATARSSSPSAQPRTRKGTAKSCTTKPLLASVTWWRNLRGLVRANDES